MQESPAAEFLIATEPGIIHQMEKLAPGKRFIPVPGGSGECACNVCPYMRRNTLENLHACLRDGAPLPGAARGAPPRRPQAARADARDGRGAFALTPAGSALFTSPRKLSWTRPEW